MDDAVLLVAGVVVLAVIASRFLRPSPRPSADEPLRRPEFDDYKRVEEMMASLVDEVNSADPVEVATEIRDELEALREKVFAGKIDLTADEARLVISQFQDRDRDCDSPEERSILEDGDRIAEEILSRWQERAGSVVPEDAMFELMRAEMPPDEFREYEQLRTEDAKIVERGMRAAATLSQRRASLSPPPTEPGCPEVHVLKELALDVMAHKSVFEDSDNPKFRRVSLARGCESSRKFCDGLIPIMERVSSGENSLWTTVENEDAWMSCSALEEVAEFLDLARTAGASNLPDTDSLVQDAGDCVDEIYAVLRTRSDWSPDLGD